MPDLTVIPENRARRFLLREGHDFTPRGMAAIKNWHDKRIARLRDVAWSMPRVEIWRDEDLRYLDRRWMGIFWEEALLPEGMGSIIVPVNIPSVSFK